MSPYRILVTGSRDWTDHAAISRALDETLTRAPQEPQIIVVHGDCPTGADIVAKVWATTWCGDERVTEEPHPAAWHVHGRAAGPKRNAHMVNLGADICLAFIRNGSRGATHTADLAEKAGIPVRRWTA